MPYCKKCKSEKTEVEFWPVKDRKSGLYPTCKKCANARAVQRRREKSPPRGKFCKSQVVNGKKICALCKEEKLLEEFHLQTHGKGGRRSSCKICTNRRYRQPYNPDLGRDQNRKANYGITRDEFLAMISKQDGKCAICGSDKGGGKYETLHVDHCHDTGKIRGLLCGSCNNGIGRFKHSSKLVQSALAYLQSHGY